MEHTMGIEYRQELSLIVSKKIGEKCNKAEDYLYQYKKERGDEWVTMVVQAIIGAIQMTDEIMMGDNDG
jgi:hypothetical protein